MPPSPPHLLPPANTLPSSPKDDPPSPIFEISHLGGGRVGDDEIAQMHAAAGITAAAATQAPQPPPSSSSNSTNPRPLAPPRAAEARVTQWIDLYPECLETVVEQPSPHWQPQVLPMPPLRPSPAPEGGALTRPRTAPGPGRTRAINAFPVELDATPSSMGGGLRPPPLRMTGPGGKGGVRRKPSREEMGRGGLPRLDTSGTKSAPSKSDVSKTATSKTDSKTDSKPITSTSPTTTTKPRRDQKPEHNRTPSSPTKWKTKPLPSIPTPPSTAPASVHTVSSTTDDPSHLLAAPPTPDSAAGGLARLETLLSANAKAIGSATPERLSSSSDTNKATAPGPPKYTRSELIWLHRNYRGELPFLRAWGLDIASAEDRAEGLEMLRELMLEEEEDGVTKGHERSGSKGSLAGSCGGMSCTGEIEVGFQQQHQGEGQ